MGEIADDIITGLSCSWCGTYFREEHGHPVVCVPCFKDWKAKNQKGKKKFQRTMGFQVATITEILGIQS